METQWDEIFLFASSAFLSCSIIFRVLMVIPQRRAMNTPYKDLFRGDEWILISLLIPSVIATLYYLLLVLPLPEFERNTVLRQNIIRSSMFTSNLVLATYFLNGKLTRALRIIVEWKQHSPTS